MIFNEIISSLYSRFSDDDLYDFSSENIWDNSLSYYETSNDNVYNLSNYSDDISEPSSTDDVFIEYKKYKEGEIYIVECEPNIIVQIVLMTFIEEMIDIVL